MEVQLSNDVYEVIGDSISNAGNKGHSLKYSFLIGSKIVGDTLDFGEKNNFKSSEDIDILFYYWGDDQKHKRKHIKQLYSLFENGERYYSNILDIFPQSGLSTNVYYNNSGVSLTDFIFKQERKRFTTPLGSMKKINLEALYLMKLTRFVEKDKKALNYLNHFFLHEFKKKIYEESIRDIDNSDNFIKENINYYIQQNIENISKGLVKESFPEIIAKTANEFNLSNRLEEIIQ